MTFSENATSVLQAWVDRFEAALSSGRPGRVGDLFAQRSYWRDILAFTWTFKTFVGPSEIGAEIVRLADDKRPQGFKINPAYPVQRKPYLGREVIDAMLDFRTRWGPCNAVVRLIDDDGEVKAWVMITHLDELTGFEESTHERVPSNMSTLESTAGDNWLDKRRQSLNYEDRDPAVLVVGGGQAGLGIAARLGALGVDALIVDRMKRVGDNWRNRYYTLTLHSETVTNSLPYMPFPPTWAHFTPKDKLADWFEFYTEAMDINFWTSTEFLSAEYDEAKGRWNAKVRRGDQERVLHPRHIVMAVGISGEPLIPRIEGLGAFAGEVLHSSEYREKSQFAGKHVFVFGTGTSGHDIVQDLYPVAASVTMVQRGPTVVIDCETARIPNAPYHAGAPVELVDKAVAFSPYPLFLEAGRFISKTFEAADKALLEKLEAKGFRLWWGEDGSGFLPMFYGRGGGYYFNVGCSNLIADGKVRVVQYEDIAAFEANAVRLSDGESLPADAVVLATGYRDLSDMMRRKFGDEVTERVGQIWGFDQRGELRNAYRQTGQPGLWFQIGSLPQARCMSKPLALQIKAVEEGLIENRLEPVMAPAEAEP